MKAMQEEIILCTRIRLMSWLWPKRSLSFVLEQPTWILTEELGWRSLSSMGWRGRLLGCTTTPRSPAHIEILFQLEIGEKWSTSLRLLLPMCFGVCQAAGALYKEWNTDLKPTKGKILVICATLREKKEKVIFLFLKTYKENKLGFSLGRLFGCYNHRELKYSEWKILLPDFVVRLYLFLEILLYFTNL